MMKTRIYFRLVTQSLKRRIVPGICSNHMLANQSIFMDVDSTIIPKVKLGNGAIVESKRKGKIAVETKKRMKYVNDVLLVPELSQNLLSVVNWLKMGIDFTLKMVVVQYLIK